MLEGKEVDVGALEAMYREMCKDIARERARLGGDWAIATVIHSQSMRDFVRSKTLLTFLTDSSSQVPAWSRA